MRGKKQNEMKHGRYPRLLSILLLISLSYVLLNCTLRNSKMTNPIKSPQAFSDSGTQKVPQRWWTVFGDDDLNRLVEQALQSNLNLRTSWQRLQEAQAIVDRVSSSFFPDLEALLQGEKRRPEFESDETLRLGLTAEYELDLWGRIRSGVAAERFRAEAARADYRTAALTLAAEVVRTWYQLLEMRNQRNLLQDQIDTNEKVLSLIRTRFGSGQIRSVDILRQRQLLESTKEQESVVESRIRLLEHQLAVLLGKPPQDSIRYAAKPLPGLPPLPDPGLPAELIRRRPDVRRAYNRLQAADKDQAVAISNQFPRLTLTASTTAGGDDADALFENWIRTFSGNLMAPLFDAGERGAEVDRREAIKRQQLYQYAQTVLTALREVEDALVLEKKQIERIERIRQQVRLAAQTYKQLRLEYLNGISDYLDVLTALTDEQQLQRDLLSARLLLLEYRIALYRALAGGFKTEREAEDQYNTSVKTE